MSSYNEVPDRNELVARTIAQNDLIRSKYKIARDLLAKKHEYQLINLQIKQFEELMNLAAENNDYDMVTYYQKLIDNRKRTYN
jgi:hypothetical protein